MVLMPIWMKNPAWNAGLNMVVAASTSLRAGKQKNCSDFFWDRFLDCTPNDKSAHEITNRVLFEFFA